MGHSLSFRGGFRRIYPSSSYTYIKYELFVLCTWSTFFCTFLCRCFAWLQREKPEMEEMSHVFLFAFFSLLLISTLMAASISHFLTVPIKFSCFSSNEIGFLCVSLVLALALLRLRGHSASLQFFSLPKSQGGHTIYHRNAWVIDMRNFTPFLHEGVDVHTDDFLRNKISWKHR